MNFLSKQHPLLCAFFLTLTLSTSELSLAQDYAESGAILTSIKPLQLIAADITRGIIAVDSLLPPGASPHAYSLRPSDVKKIHRAVAIFWVGPAMETFLEKPFAKYPLKSHQLSALIETDVNANNASTNTSSDEKDHHLVDSAAKHDGHDHEEHEGHEEHEEKGHHLANSAAKNDEHEHEHEEHEEKDHHLVDSAAKHDGHAHEEKDHHLADSAAKHDEHEEHGHGHEEEDHHLADSAAKHDEHEEHGHGHEEEDHHLADSAAKHNEHEHDEHPRQNEVHLHTYQGNDPHIWLNPKKALQIAELMRDQISHLYPQHERQLSANFEQFSKQLDLVDQQLRSAFSPLKALGFLVFHDAYSRFVDDYQLNQIAALTINPAQRPGAKHLADIRQMIATTQPVCMFSEPQFAGVAIDTVVRGFEINISELDPLAINAKLTQNAYASFLRGFGQQFIDCLSR